jgi:anti-anti-sigma factor
MLGRISNQGGLIEMHLIGRLDGAATAMLRQGLDAVALYGDGDVVLDFREVTFIDGSAVGAVAYLFKRLTADGRKLRVTGATGQPCAMLVELGIATLLGIEATATATPKMHAAGLRAWMNPVARGVTSG